MGKKKENVFDWVQQRDLLCTSERKNGEVGKKKVLGCCTASLCRQWWWFSEMILASSHSFTRSQIARCIVIEAMERVTCKLNANTAVHCVVSFSLSRLLNPNPPINLYA